MRTRTFITVTDVRRNTVRVVAQVRTSAAPVFVTQHGYVVAVLMSPDDYDALCAEARSGWRRMELLALALLRGPR